MGTLSDLPVQLILVIVDYLHDDRKALRACALVSRVFVAPSQAHLFERIMLWHTLDPTKHTLGPATGGNIEVMQKSISPDPDGILQYTRSLSIFLSICTKPRRLEEIYDHWVAFKNIRELRTYLFATPFIRRGRIERYFPHFQPTLRCLRLMASLRNPTDLVTFIAFFPLLEDVTIEALPSSAYSSSGSKSEGFNPDELSPLKGSLRLHAFHIENDFLVELAKVRLQYRTVSISETTVWTGFQELIITCAPTLRVLNVTRRIRELYSWFNLATDGLWGLSLVSGHL